MLTGKVHSALPKNIQGLTSLGTTSSRRVSERRIARREDATRCDGVTVRVGVRPRIERAVATTQGSGRSADEGLHSETQNHGNGKAPGAGRREGLRARRA